MKSSWGHEQTISLNVKGSGSLAFLPLADSAAVTMSGNWKSPSFTGRQLPDDREIRDDGFDASWSSTRIGRNLPSAWIVLAIVMYVTRGIDWYAAGSDDQKQASSD